MIDGDQLRRDLHDLQAVLRNAASQALREAVNAAQQTAKNTSLFRDRTGATRKSITGAVFGSNGVVEARGAAVFLQNGTRPHTISARNAKTLAFQVNGRTVFRRSVKHPGTAARPFMTEAERVGEQTLLYGLEYFTEYATRKFAS